MPKTYEDLTPQQQKDFDTARAFATAANTVHTNLLSILRGISPHINGSYYPVSPEDPFGHNSSLKAKRRSIKIHQAMFERELEYANYFMPGRAAFDDTPLFEVKPLSDDGKAEQQQAKDTEAISAADLILGGLKKGSGKIDT